MTDAHTSFGRPNESNSLSKKSDSRYTDEGSPQLEVVCFTEPSDCQSSGTPLSVWAMRYIRHAGVDHFWVRVAHFVSGCTLLVHIVRL